MIKHRVLPSVDQVSERTPNHPLDFFEGLDTRGSDISIDERAVADGRNMFFIEQGGADKRLGTTLKGNVLGVTTGILGMFQYVNRAGTQEFLTVYDTAIHRDVASVWTALTSMTLTTNKQADGVYYSETDKFYLTNKTDNVAVYTSGASGTTDASIPKGRWIEEYDGRLVIANVTNQEDRLWVSDLGVDTFGANNWAAAEGAITGLLSMGPQKLLVTTEKKCYLVNNLTSTPNAAGPEQFRDIGAGVGCVDGKTLVNINGFGYFLGLDSENVAQVYITDGFRVTPIGDPVRRILSTVNPTYLTNATAVRFGRYYRLALTPSGGTTNTIEIIYDTIRKTWQTEFRPGFPISYYVTIKSSGQDILYAGHQSLGIVFQVSTGNYDTLPDQTYTTGQDADEAITGSTTVRRAQGFKLSAKTSETRKVVGGALLLKKNGGTTAELTVRIETDSAGVPSGTLVDSNATTTIAAFSDASYVWKTFTFSTAPTLTGSTQYHLVAKHTTEGSGSSDYRWGADSSSPTYSDGSLSRYASGAWSAVSGSDALFILFIQEQIEGYVITKAHAFGVVNPKLIQHVNVVGASSTGVTAKLGISTGGYNGSFNEEDLEFSGGGTVWASSTTDTTTGALYWASSRDTAASNQKWASASSKYEKTVFFAGTVEISRYLNLRFYHKGVGRFAVYSYIPYFEIIQSSI